MLLLHLSTIDLESKFEDVIIEMRKGTEVTGTLVIEKLHLMILA